MTKALLVVIALGAAGSWSGTQPAAAGRRAERREPLARPDTIVVKMVDKGPTAFAFEPAHLRAHPGDVLHFVQTASTPHDVQFTKFAPHSHVSSAPSAFLTTPGQTYNVAIGTGFTPGHYVFICMPHATLGMTGTLDVVAGPSN